MKKLYILMIGLFSLLTYSCVKEGGNEFKPDLPPPVVSGYEKAYTVYSHQDTLKINPAVADEGQYDFFWTVFPTGYTPGAGVIPRGDTLSRTKNLKYEVLLNPGDYILIFNVKNKKTLVTQMITSDLSVSTLTMNGWYILKDDGLKTDFDFFHTNGRIDNWISFFNGGKSLNGKSIKSIFAGSFKTGLNSPDLYNVLMVISDQDAGIYRIDNGKLVMGFDNMFFTKPAVRRPQNVLQPMANNFIHLINDGKMYSMVKGSFFADPPVSTYKISPIAGVGAIDIAFDENSKSIIGVDGASYYPLGKYADSIKNMNANIVWMAGYPALRGAAIVLFRKNTGDGYLVRMNTAYGSFTGSTFPGTPPLIQDTKVVSKTHGLMSADVIGGNYDSDYIYYAKGNQVYMTNASSLPETPLFSLPAGETVTCMQHIKYPQPATGVVQTTDYLAIASYANGKYKVWLHKISSTGTIQALSKPNFEGQGKVSAVNYIEKGNGNRTF